MGWHALFLVVAGGCGVAEYWQVGRALGGNTLSWLYVFEWPAAAVVAAIGWWQLVHDTDEDIARRRAHHAAMRAASARVVAASLPRSALAITVSSEEVDGRALGTGQRVAIASPEPRAGAELVPAGGRDTAPIQFLAPEADPAEDDELDAYNRYLATLAVRGRAKTWRNPRGT